MGLSSMLLLAAVLVGVVLFVTRPFIERERFPVEGDKDLSSLLAEHERVLGTLKDLDFDHTLGKIPEEEYSAQRTALLHRGVKTLRQLDIHRSGVLLPGTRTGQVKGDSGRKIQTGKNLTDDDLEDLIDKRRSLRKSKPGGFCPACGKPVLQSDRYCPSCGNSFN